MMRFFCGIAFSSIILATTTLPISVNAETSNVTTKFNYQYLPYKFKTYRPKKSKPSPTPSPTDNGQSNTSLGSIEQAIQTQINQYRAKKGLPGLTLDERISNKARIHSQNMANGTVAFGHKGFETRVQQIGTMIPYKGAAENVAYNMGYSDAATKAVEGWLNSPGHRQNIEGNYNLTGIGVAKNAKGEYYFTQIFILRR